MKKRFFALLLAVLMIASAIPTAAFAAEEPLTPQGVVRKCPFCDEGIFETRLVSEVEVGTVTPRTLTVCYCGYGKYNCFMTMYKFEEIYQVMCNRCSYVEGTTHEYVTRAMWEHYGCKGSGCGH